MVFLCCYNDNTMNMNTNLDSYPVNDAVIYLKDGKRKYGMLIDTPAKDAYYFISNADLYVFLQTKSGKYIEMLSPTQVEAIEMDLK